MTATAVPAEQLEQIVGKVKIGLANSIATILAVSKALPPPKPKITSAAATSSVATSLSMLA